MFSIDKKRLVATDNEIDLTVPFYVKKPYEYYDIYLHNTDEYVGNIWCDTSDDYELIKYLGNVGYEIKEEYRGNHYALKALQMIKEIMKDNNMREMIFSIEPKNTYSVNVAKQMGATRVGSEYIPSNVGLYTFKDSEVDIYKYNLIGEERKK